MLSLKIDNRAKNELNKIVAWVVDVHNEQTATQIADLFYSLTTLLRNNPYLGIEECLLRNRKIKIPKHKF